MTKAKVVERLRDASRDGRLDGYLDELGRAAARQGGPKYVAEMDMLVSASVTKVRGQGGGRKRPERDDRPEQTDWLEELGEESSVADLVAKLSEAEYWIGEDLVSRDVLQHRLDLAVRLQLLREADGAFWEAKEDHARGNKEWAQWDANILRVVVARLSSGDAVAAE